MTSTRKSVDESTSVRGAPTARSRAGAGRPAPGTLVLHGQHLDVRYDLASGRWQIEGDAAGVSWRLEASAVVELIDPLGQVERRDVASAALVSCDETAPEAVGREVQVWRAWPDGLTVRQRLAVTADEPSLVAELAVRAPRDFRLSLRALSPLVSPDSSVPNLRVRDTTERHSAPAMPTAPLRWQVLDVGWSAAEPAVVRPLVAGEPRGATGLAAVGDRRGRFRLTMGFLDATAAVGRYRFEASDLESLRLEGEADFGTVELGTGEVSSGPLWIRVGPVEVALARFADAWRGRHLPGVRPPSLVEWTTPESAARPPTEARVLDALGSLAGWSGVETLDAVTVGAGWEASEGDWTPDPERFPRGFLALRDLAHAEGWRVGIAISPLLVSRTSELFHRHPGWVLRSSTGDPIAVAPDQPDLFALDPSQPCVVDWLRSIGRGIADEWALDLARIDRLEQCVVAGWQANGYLSPVQAYRRGLAALRESLGGRPLIASGAPLFASLGEVDGLLTDSAPLWRADPSTPLRAFLWRTGGLTGAGPLSMDREGQTLDEARAAATIASLAGGIVTLVGDLSALPPERLEALRACLPPYDASSIVPIDPLGPDGPSLFACRVKAGWDDYLLLLALNSRDVPVARVIPLERLGLPPGRYHAYEFWSQRYLGIVTERLAIEHIPAGGCAVVAIRQALDEPRVVGTSLHVTLGAMALQGASFDRRNCRLHLAVGAVGEREGTIAVALPRGWTPGPLRGTGGDLSIRQTTERLAVIDVRFKDVAEMELEFWPRSSR